jgi:predicted double-glycine peptidase
MRQGRDQVWRRGLAAWFAAAVALTVAANAPDGGAAEASDGKPVRSLAEMRNEAVVRQQWDLTCGAAAIATLLTYQLGHPVTERQVVSALLRRTGVDLVRLQLGFSLLDLKNYAASQGFAASGFGGLTLDDLDALAPAIVPIRAHGFRHFVVYRGRRGDRVLIADPAFGNRTLPYQAFNAIWANGIGFIVVDPAQPHPPNRMGAPAELFLVPGFQAQRLATASGGPWITITPLGTAP